MNVFHTSFFNGRTFYHIDEIFWRIKSKFLKLFFYAAIVTREEWWNKQAIKHIFKSDKTSKIQIQLVVHRGRSMEDMPTYVLRDWLNSI